MRDKLETTSLGAINSSYRGNTASPLPLPPEREVCTRTMRIIRLVKDRGLSMTGSEVLDVGCGTGAFSLPLAQHGAIVTALDTGENTLKRLATEAQRMAVSGIRTIQASWKEIDPVTSGLSGKFDIVLSALSNAVEKEEDILKMEQCSREWCICIAEGHIRRHALCETAFRAVGIPLDPRPDIRTIQDKLTKMKRSYSYDSFTLTIEENKSFGELAEDMARRIEGEERTPDRSRIRKTLFSLYPLFKVNNTVRCKRWTDIGLLIWKTPNNPPVSLAKGAQAPGAVPVKLINQKGNPLKKAGKLPSRKKPALDMSASSGPVNKNDPKTLKNLGVDGISRDPGATHTETQRNSKPQERPSTRLNTVETTNNGPKHGFKTDRGTTA